MLWWYWYDLFELQKKHPDSSGMDLILFKMLNSSTSILSGFMKLYSRFPNQPASYYCGKETNHQNESAINNLQVILDSERIFKAWRCW